MSRYNSIQTNVQGELLAQFPLRKIITICHWGLVNCSKIFWLNPNQNLIDVIMTGRPIVPILLKYRLKTCRHVEVKLDKGEPLGSGMAGIAYVIKIGNNYLVVKEINIGNDSREYNKKCIVTKELLEDPDYGRSVTSG